MRSGRCAGISTASFGPRVPKQDTRNMSRLLHQCPGSYNMRMLVPHGLCKAVA